MSVRRFSLAHLSDLHVAPTSCPGVRALLNKRLLGYVALCAHRRATHRPEILDALADDLERIRPDHVAVTGDLTTLALPAEFEAARACLQRFGSGEGVSVVPGNHDAYVRVPRASSLALWDDHMTTDGIGGPVRPPAGRGDFPWLRRRSFLALLGLSSAVPTAPFVARGRLGPEQLAGLETALEALAREHVFRVVLLHHGPVEGAAGWRRCLADAAAFRAVIARAGAELVLHGHEHRASERTIPGPAGPVPVLGVPPASALPSPGRERRGAQYHVITIEDHAGGWQILLEPRRFDAATVQFAPLDRRRLGAPRPIPSATGAHPVA